LFRIALRFKQFRVIHVMTAQSVAPWNLSDDQKERLATLVRWNTPIVRA